MPIEARGRKDPALAAAIKAGRLPEPETEWEYVVGRKPLRVGDEVRQPGDPIPEAATWPRLESWLHTGAVVKRPPGAGAAVTATPAPKKPAPARARPTPPQPDAEPTQSVLRPARPLAGARS